MNNKILEETLIFDEKPKEDNTTTTKTEPTDEIKDTLDEIKIESGHENVNKSSSPKKDKKQSSFFRNLKVSIINRNKINSNILLKCRFRKLAGINLNPTVARLKLKNNIVVDLTEIPSWYDVIRYKICGFDYEIVDCSLFNFNKYYLN